MSTFAKLILIVVGLWPFAVLAGNARRTVSFSFVAAAAISTVIGGGVLYCFHSSGRHPHVSAAFLILFCLWPVALIAAKIREPSLSGKRLWLSVPLMSWFTVTTAVSTNYPVHGGGGGFGMLVTLVLGWFYMVPLFGFLHLCYLLFRYARRRHTTVA